MRFPFRPEPAAKACTSPQATGGRSCPARRYTYSASAAHVIRALGMLDLGNDNASVVQSESARQAHPERP